MISGSGPLSLLGWIISFTILSTLVVVLRFWSAHLRKRKLASDDFFLLVSYVAMLAQVGVGIWGLEYGMGNPAQDFTPADLVVIAQVLSAASTTWIFSTTFYKIAVLIFYLRIFPSKTFSRFAYALMAAVGAFGIAFFFVFLFHCDPIDQQWNPVPWGTCHPLDISEKSSISLNLVLDLFIVILPMPWLWQLQTSVGRKLVITAMFSFGFATIAIMCYRLYLTVNPWSDPLLLTARIGLLSYLELWLGIIVTCIPTMAPFFRTYIEPGFSRLSSRLYGGNSNRSGGSRETPGVSLRTFGGSGGSNNSGGKKPSLDSTSEYDDIRLTSESTTGQFRANCETGDAHPDTQNGGIYVQQYFSTEREHRDVV